MKPITKMVTIYEIAKKAGVSPATVSRVLNNGPVKSSTKEKILKIIEKENFVPDNRAVYLKKINTRKIGLIIPDILNPIYSLAVKVIHDYLKEKDYHLILGNSYGNVDEEKDILELFERERVAGVIIGTCEGEDDSSLIPIFDRMLKSGIKIVFTGKKNYGLKVDVISVNNEIGTYKITNYLIKTGRKKIGFISGDRNLRATEERLSGYIKALKEKGIGINKELIICEGEYKMENGRKFAKELISKVDAILCGNDLMAIGAIKAVEESGLKVPDDIGICGFDDIFISYLIKPSLTTVHQPIEKISEIACERLIGWIEGKIKKEEEILIEPEIIVRESA
ncbi:MAG TPA: LacI family DNA-binding transcriptional regulator [bacterium]|nr:LacI family DNA-binding transcriptional regulator [bacterium]HOM26667.1 LacI family DNA-binding transcriptional regulator [bacterium]